MTLLFHVCKHEKKIVFEVPRPKRQGCKDQGQNSQLMWTKTFNVAIQGVFETTFVLGTPMATLLGGWLVLDHKKEWNAINQHT